MNNEKNLNYSLLTNQNYEKNNTPNHSNQYISV